MPDPETAEKGAFGTWICFGKKAKILVGICFTAESIFACWFILLEEENICNVEHMEAELVSNHLVETLYTNLNN